MKVRDTLSYSFSAIRLRKLRSGLTTLGIVIGIAAIVALLSFTQGFQVSITNQLEEGFATNTLIVVPGNLFQIPGQTTNNDFTLYVNDTNAIRTVDGVVIATPVMSNYGTVQSGDRSLDLTIRGINYTEYSAIYSSTFVAELGDIPSSPANTSVVIGHSIYDPWNNGTLFAEVGDTLTISHTIRDNGATHQNTINVTVVGVLGEIGGTSIGGGPSDTGVYLTIDTATSLFESSEISSVVVQLVSDDSTVIDNASSDIEALFDGDVTAISSTSVLAIVDTLLGTVGLLLGGIAAISLLVAGIGIMNIMIVSLMERTREIGILKALGAKNRSVLGIFLSEALLIGILGGAIGIAAGMLIANIISGAMGGGFGMMGSGGFGGSSSGFLGTITPVLTPSLLFWAMFYGVFVSVLFGLYPAWRASKLDPVEALRKE